MSIFEDERFLPLKEMESFTDDLMNRLFAFQERKHPAWDEKAPFEQRIAGIPLHYLVFSNPDRDPAKFGPTVAPFYPLRDELRVFAHCARQVAKDPVVLDVNPGNGFIGTLLAREGLTVIGSRDPAQKRNQIENFYDPTFYDMREIAPQQVDFPFDVAFCAWMPAGVNQTPLLTKHKPKLIIYIYTEHADDNGQPMTGTPEAFTNLPDNYSMIAEWDITRPKDLFREVWPDLTGSPEEVRVTKIFADEPYRNIDVTSIQRATPYSWEEELQMAALALEAKQLLKQQGYKV